MDCSPPPRYAGFWMRTLASLIDTLCLGILLYPLTTLLGGGSFTQLLALMDGSSGASSMDMAMMMSQSSGSSGSGLEWLLYAVLIILFWKYRSATPGKMILGMVIVDANTLQPPSTGQCVIRYLGYYLSLLPLMLGFFWVAFDSRKQGWHDKLAGTLVIYKK